MSGYLELEGKRALVTGGQVGPSVGIPYGAGATITNYTLLW